MPYRVVVNFKFCSIGTVNGLGLDKPVFEIIEDKFFNVPRFLIRKFE